MFKEQYKNDNQMITPSPELLDKISAQMAEQVRLNQSGKAIPFGNMTKIVACAACACIVIGAAVVIPQLNGGGVQTSSELATTGAAEALDAVYFAETTTAAQATEAEAFDEETIAEDDEMLVPNGFADESLEGDAAAASGGDITEKNADEPADDDSGDNDELAFALPTVAVDTESVDTESVDMDSDDTVSDDVEESVVADELVDEDCDVEDDLAVPEEDDDSLPADDNCIYDCDDDVSEPTGGDELTDAASDEYIVKNAPTLGAFISLFGKPDTAEMTVRESDDKVCLYCFDGDKLAAVFDKISAAPVIEKIEGTAAGAEAEDYSWIANNKDGTYYYLISIRETWLSIQCVGIANATAGTGYFAYYSLDESTHKKLLDYYNASKTVTFDLSAATNAAGAIGVISSNLSDSYTAQITADIIFTDGTKKQEKLHLSEKQAAKLLKNLAANNEVTIDKSRYSLLDASNITVEITDEKNEYLLRLKLLDYVKPIYSIELCRYDLASANVNPDNADEVDYDIILFRTYRLVSGEFEKLYELIMGDNAPSGRAVADPEADVEEVEEEDIPVDEGYSFAD